MFVRVKKSGPRQYLQVVESRWEEGATRQRVVATLGRLDKLQAKGNADGLMRSLARFANRVRVVEDAASGRLAALSARRIGPAMVFERFWGVLCDPRPAVRRPNMMPRPRCLVVSHCEQRLSKFKLSKMSLTFSPGDSWHMPRRHAWRNARCNAATSQRVAPRAAADGDWPALHPCRELGR